MKRPIALGCVLLLGLSACTAQSVQSNYTVTPESLALQVATAIEDQVGIMPEINCGDDEIDLVVGAVAQCDLTVPGEPEGHTAIITITQVDGKDFAFDVDINE